MRSTTLLFALAAPLFAQVPYEIRDGYAVTRGDILIGTAAEMEAKTPAERASAAVPGPGGRWTNGTMHFLIDADVPNQDRIQAAVDHWNTRTPLRIEPYTGQSNRVRFQRVSSSGLCTSFVGMRGGEQVITVPDSCSSGSLVHEIGHAFGLLHEQERADRDTWVTVLLQNIEPQYIYAFEPDARGTLDLEYYDYDSIMHYSPTGFSRGFVDTIETVPPGIPIGQRAGLSAGDIDAVSRLYGIVPTMTTIATIPAGLNVVVDGETAATPRSFSWEAGSTHTIEAAAQTGENPRHKFVRWSDGGEPSHTITASPDRTVYAAVYQRQRPVTIRRGTGSGAVSLAPASDDGYYPERLPLRLTAEPAGTHQFFSWSGQPNVSTGGQGFASPVANVQVGTSAGDIVGNFAPAPLVKFDSEPRGLQIQADGSTYRTPVMLQWTPGSTHSVGVAASQSRHAGMAVFNFLSWSDGGASTHEVTAAASGVMTLTARFSTRYRLDVSTGGGGSVVRTPSSSDGFYDAGSQVRLTPVGNTFSTHLYWTGDLAGGGEQTIVMDAPKTILASFGPALPFVIYNGASFTLNPRTSIPLPVLTPGEIVTVFSDNVIGPPALVTAQIAGNRFSTDLGGTSILFNGTPAALIYAAEKQVSAIVPWNVSGAVTVVIQRGGETVAQQQYGVSPTFPALFTANARGTGQVAALNGDLTINSRDNPTTAGGVIVLYCTGSGDLNTRPEDGAIADGNLIGVRGPVMVRIGKLPAEVIYAGSAPGIVQGAFQVNVIVPKEALPDLAAPIQLIVGNASSPVGTTIAIR